MNNEQSLHDLETLDRKRLEMLFGNNRELLEEIYQIVLSDFPELSQKLADAAKRRSYTEISQYAHTLKGSIANVGGVRSSRTAHKINIAAKEHDDHQVDELYALFGVELDEFIEALRVYAAGEQ